MNEKGQPVSKTFEATSFDALKEHLNKIKWHIVQLENEKYENNCETSQSDIRPIKTSTKYCPKCNKNYDDSWTVCLNCGDKLIMGAPPPIEERMDASTEKKYKPAFLMYFIVGLTLLVINSIAIGINHLTISNMALILFNILKVFFCILVNNAYNSVGKKYGWAWGLISFIPFGSWVVFFMVRNELKPRNKW